MAKIVSKTVVVSSVGEGVNAGFKTEQLAGSLKIAREVWKRVGGVRSASVWVDSCEVELKRSRHIFPKNWKLVSVCAVVAGRREARKRRYSRTWKQSDHVEGMVCKLGRKTSLLNAQFAHPTKFILRTRT